MSSYYEKMLATGEVKCIDEEVPFEIPQGWEWCRMGSIGDWGEKAVKRSQRFHEITGIGKMAKRASQYLSLGNRAGEGWFLTADMIDLLYHECRGIVCLQPFACLPNHITGEGMVHKLHAAYPEAVFLALDCDASASEVNQENRLKLMMNALTEKTKAPKEMSFIQKTMNLRKGTTL